MVENWACKGRPEILTLGRITNSGLSSLHSEHEGSLRSMSSWITNTDRHIYVQVCVCVHTLRCTNTITHQPTKQPNADTYVCAYVYFLPRQYCLLHVPSLTSKHFKYYLEIFLFLHMITPSEITIEPHFRIITPYISHASILKVLWCTFHCGD